MRPPEIERVFPSRIPEVTAFAKAAGDLAAFLEAHPELAELAARYNATLAAASEIVRGYPRSAVVGQGRPIASGPFDLYEWRRTDSAQALYDHVGRQRFASFGGKVETIEALSIERKIFDARVVAGDVPTEVLAAVVAWSPRYHEPKKLVLP